MPKPSLLSRYVAWVIAHPFRVLLLGLAVTAVSIPCAMKLKLQSNLIALLPKSAPSVQALDRIIPKSGGAGDLILLLEGKGLETSITCAESLMPKIKALPWAGEIAIGRDTSFFDKHKLLYMKLDDLKEIKRRVIAREKYEKLKKQPLYVDLEDEEDDEKPKAPSIDFSDIEDKYKGKGKRRRYFASAEGDVLLMVIYPKGVASNLGFVRRIHRQLTKLVKDHQHNSCESRTMTVGGTFRNRLDEFDTIMNDVLSSSLWAGIGLFLLITLYFRHPLAMLIISLPLGMSIAWAFGISYFTVGRLNLITIFLTVVLMGLGIDFGIHMFARFQEERLAGKNAQDTLMATMRHAGRASLIAALTTAASFFVLMISDFAGFSEFGIIAGTGLLTSAAAFLTVLIAILALAHRWRLSRPLWGKGAKVKPGRPLRGAAGIVAVSAVLIAGALWVGRGAEFEWDNRAIRSKVARRSAFNAKMRKVFSKARDPSVVLVEDDARARAVTAALDAKRKVDGDKSPILEVRSATSLLPQKSQEKVAILRFLEKKVDKIVDDLKDPKQKKKLQDLRPHLKVKAITSVDQLPEHITRPFFGNRDIPGQMVFIFQRKSLMNLHNAVDFSKVARDTEVDGKTYTAASEPLVLADLVELLGRDGPRTVSLAALMLVFLLFFDFRRISHVLVVLVPLLAGVVWMVGCMALVPIKLNILNAAVLPSVLGLGIDGGVHLFHRVRELGRDQMTRVIRETGGAVAACTGTSMIGFGGMLSANHPGLYSIGVLAIYGLGACLIASVLLLPAILSFVSTGKRGDATD